MRHLLIPLLLIQPFNPPTSAQTLDTAKLDSFMVYMNKQYSNTELFDHYTDSIYQLLQGSPYQKQKAAAAKFRGMSFYARTLYDSSLAYFQEGLQLNRQMRDSLEAAKCLINIAGAYSSLYQFEDGITYALEARSIFELIQDDKGINHVNNLLGSFHYYKKEYKEALQYFKTNYTNNTLRGDTAEIVVALNNMGATYEILEQPDSTIYCAKQVLNLGETFKLINPGYTYQTLGLAYYKNENFHEAIEHFERAKSLYEEKDKTFLVADIYYYLARSYQATAQWTKAKPLLQKSIAHAQQTNNLNAEKEALKVLSEIQHQTGQSGLAYENLERYLVLNDSVLNEANQRNITEMRTKYETESKDRQLKLQDLEIREQTAVLQNRKLTIGVMTIGLTLLVLGGYMLIYKQRKNQQIQLQEQALTFSEEKLHSVIHSQEQERKRFAKDLHDGFGQVISILKMNVAKINSSELEKRNEVYEQTKSMLDEMYDELRGICFDLMPQTLVEQGLISAIREFASRLNIAGKITVDVHEFGMEDRLEELQETALYRIVQEWTNNIMKYGSADRITIQLTKDQTELTLTIEDNGQGFDTSELTNSKGNGWRNMQSRARLIEGEIEIDSRPEMQGTTLFMNVPILANVPVPQG
ncbi:tetratricopeptide repeat-containing sensor histidine kinase [Reichenbachiella sp.]|uniref:tetratricopeptide repeat-containing sensor histidine kinase n=1 Tax=Reichenbachiella sp. TaxID=2184521 RepID=UPI003B59AFE5